MAGPDAAAGVETGAATRERHGRRRMGRARPCASSGSRALAACAPGSENVDEGEEQSHPVRAAAPQSRRQAGGNPRHSQRRGLADVPPAHPAPVGSRPSCPGLGAMRSPPPSRHKPRQNRTRSVKRKNTGCRQRLLAATAWWKPRRRAVRASPHRASRQHGRLAGCRSCRRRARLAGDQHWLAWGTRNWNQRRF